MNHMIQKILPVLFGISLTLNAFADIDKFSSMDDIVNAALKRAKETVDTSKFKKKPPYTIGFSNHSVVNSWRIQMVRELQAEADRHKDVIKDFFITDANGSISKQISDVQDLLAKGIDALVLAPLSPDALVPTVTKAVRQGVPVIVFNSSITGGYTSFVGQDQVQFGYVIAKWLMQKMNCQGNLIVLDGVAGNSITEERFQGLEKAIKECSDPSQIKILARYPSDWAYDKGKLSTERALAAYPKIDGVWSQGGAMTQGAIEAFQAAHRSLAPMTGEDNNGFLKIWQKLKPDGFSSCAGSEPTWEGAIALVFALRALQGEPVPKDFLVPVPTLTDENLDKYVRPDLSDSFWANTRLPEQEIKKDYAAQ